MSAIETPSKVAASALASLDFKDEQPKDTLLSKMLSTKDESRTYKEITMDNGKKLQHASQAPRGKFVGDLSITDDKQEPLLQETELFCGS